MHNYYLSRQEASEILVDFFTHHDDSTMPFWAARMLDHFDLDEDDLRHESEIEEESEDRFEMFESEDFLPFFED